MIGRAEISRALDQMNERLLAVSGGEDELAATRDQTRAMLSGFDVDLDALDEVILPHALAFLSDVVDGKMEPVPAFVGAITQGVIFGLTLEANREEVKS